MKQIIIIAIVLYLLFLVIYLFRERMQKRRKNAARKPVFNPFRAAPKEDIIGKSTFDLRHSLPQATTLQNSEKAIENSDTFADESEKKTSAAIPLDKLDDVFSDTKTPDEDSDNINIEIENKPPELEPDYGRDSLDEEETEEANTEEVAGASVAIGLGFDDMGGMLNTVNNEKEATPDQREEAGRVLVEIRMTDMFEQVVSGEPKKQTIVSSLMDDYFSAFRRKQREAGKLNEPEVKVPDEFEVRSFA